MMEALVGTACDLTSQGQWTALCQLLDDSRQLLASAGVSQLNNLLSQLHVGENTLLWLSLLLAKCDPNRDSSQDAACQEEGDSAAGEGAASPRDSTMRQFRRFVAECRGELVRQHRPRHFAQLCVAIADRLLDTPAPQRGAAALSGVAAMKGAVLVARASEGQLTSAHVLLCRLCLAAQCPAAALSLLDDDVTDISLERGFFTVQHLLLFYYYAGLVYAALKQHERAALFFEIYYLVPAPTAALSAIMVEAFKKHVLVSLVLGASCQSAVSSSPLSGRFHESLRRAAVRRLRPLCRAYVELAAAFSAPVAASGDGDALAAVAARHRVVFERDRNWGLVKQCLAAQRRLAVQRLTRTFVTLPLADLSCRTSLEPPAPRSPAPAAVPGAEWHVLSMISDGSVRAVIDQRLGMLRFVDSAGFSDVDRLGRDMALLMSLQRRLQTLDERLQLDREYVAKSDKSHEEEAGHSGASTTAGEASSSSPATSSVKLLYGSVI